MKHLLPFFCKILDLSLKNNNNHNNSSIKEWCCFGMARNISCCCCWDSFFQKLANYFIFSFVMCNFPGIVKETYYSLPPHLVQWHYLTIHVIRFESDIYKETKLLLYLNSKEYSRMIFFPALLKDSNYSSYSNIHSNLRFCFHMNLIVVLLSKHCYFEATKDTFKCFNQLESSPFL